MKKLILFSSLLMFIALVAGAIDFANESRKGELAKMYEDGKTAMFSSLKKKAAALPKKEITPVVEEEATTATVDEEKKQTVKEATTQINEEEQEITFESFSRGAIDYKFVREQRMLELQMGAKVKAETDSVVVAAAVDSLSDGE